MHLLKRESRKAAFKCPESLYSKIVQECLLPLDEIWTYSTVILIWVAKYGPIVGNNNVDALAKVGIAKSGL